MKSDFFTGNRQRLYANLQSNSVLVLTAYTQLQRGNDFPYPFEQESNFWYLTGVEAPDWRLLVDVKTGAEWLIAPTATTYQTLFEGALSGDAAAKTSGIANILGRAEGHKKMLELVKARSRTYTLGSFPTRIYGFAPNPAQRNLNRQLAGAKNIEDVRLPLAKLRAIKQPVELAAMQQAIDITIEGITALLAQARNLQYDYQADALLSYEFRRRGHRHAFDPILSSGKNNTILHYLTNGSVYHKDDWLLLDVGAKVRGYSADIARTVPLGATTQRQLDVYEAVREVNIVTMNMLRPGLNLREYLQHVDDAMAGRLQHLGLLKGKPSFKKVRTYFPHSISHGLGIDPHDPLGRPETLQEGMVLTVEAGIYIPAESIGVRIEDDLLITKSGAKNLSAKLPIDLQALGKMVY